MAQHEKFDSKSLEDLREKIKDLGLKIELDEDTTPLGRPVKVGAKTAENTFAALPMEGCDSTCDGTPGTLTRRRYLRLARGGYGLIWWEACAVAEEGRANEHQMQLNVKNVGGFAELVRAMKSTSLAFNGFEPINILQLTHSGRYSRPFGHALKPLVPQHDPMLDPIVGISPEDPIVSDEYLDSLIPQYVKSALLAQQAGFDGVDIKCCNRYLLNELLASHTREGKYGGSFENRTRLILKIVECIRLSCGSDFIIACRLNMFDAHPYPYGFGCAKNCMWEYDLAEPLALIEALCQAGVGLLSSTAGNPYYIYPQLGRPFDITNIGVPLPQEHPLESLARLFEFARMAQHTAGEIPVVGNGYSCLRSYLPYAGAAALKKRSCSFVGLGRSSFAYPNAPRDMLMHGAMDPGKCCVTCSKCTQIMRDHGTTGCVVRDSKLYVPLYLKYRAEADKRSNKDKKTLSGGVE